jgi:hypothetical protein
LANSILKLLEEVGDKYKSHPEQMSLLILNIFDLWIKMDYHATIECPLLAEYHPKFTPELLDVLQLASSADMLRLQSIQTYLQLRIDRCTVPHMTILDEATPRSFAVRYFEQSGTLQSLSKNIGNDSDMARSAKKAEFKHACEIYQEHSEKIAAGTCVCSFNADGSRNVRGCDKCFRFRERRRMAIGVHEDYLPADGTKSAAVVFELGIPEYLAIYRNVAWKLICLGYPSQPQPSVPVKSLLNKSRLSSYSRSSYGGITLASSTKSFVQTHYKTQKMMVKESNILLPLGLDFAYYDANTKQWIRDFDKNLTYAHLCGVWIPRALRRTAIPQNPHPPPYFAGVSSSDIVANVTKCPPDMSTHEFAAYQKVLSGNSRRWLEMLSELGASNLNFSIEDTSRVFSQLAIQAGPSTGGFGHLRDIHCVFQDASFCARLANQIQHHLETITTNWRESTCMELIINLSLRMFHLTSGAERQTALELLQLARQTTLRWIASLREEVRNASEAKLAERAAQHGFRAALLCRKTFATFIQTRSVTEASPTTSATMMAQDLDEFVEASIALQQNLVVDLKALPTATKNLLISDAKLVHGLQTTIKTSIDHNKATLDSAVINLIGDSSSSTNTRFSAWKVCERPYSRWIMSTMTMTRNRINYYHIVHYNYVEGHLLMGGKPLGKLPRDVRESRDVKELFGDRHLRTWPSYLPGMSYWLDKPIQGFQIHFGLRRETVIIQAVRDHDHWEFVPRRIFTTEDHFDLPSSLINDSFHWLNLNAESLEIRKAASMWKTKPSDWVVHIHRGRACRNNVLLVDPQSSLFKKVADIFRHFEQPCNLTVFQPLAPSGRLSVELRNLELSFFVNSKGLLECRELRSEIDPNQDAGTLYGFDSKIVLRDTVEPERRSIITALGGLTYKREGIHVLVRANSTTEYGLFMIDQILGRLTCLPEPRLVFSKALFHAFTSFHVPDGLTQRTGAEEAMHILQSGHCQPWAPLDDLVMPILRQFNDLIPKRSYYPTNKRSLQKVVWNQDLPISVQQDAYNDIIRSIINKHRQLLSFSPNNMTALTNAVIEMNQALRDRADQRRQLYERSVPQTCETHPVRDVVYQPRDRNASSAPAQMIFRMAQSIRGQHLSFDKENPVAAILQAWPLINGFHGKSTTRSSLTELTDRKISEQWGSLVDMCRQTRPQNVHQIMFNLALLCFNKQANQNIINLLSAFTYLQPLKQLTPSSAASFSGFKLHERPSFDALLQLIVTDYPFVDLDPAKKMLKNTSLQKQSDDYEKECRKLARFFCNQWPASELFIEDFDAELIDEDMSLNTVTPEWRRLVNNERLSVFVDEVQLVIDQHRVPKVSSGPQPWPATQHAFYQPMTGAVVPSLSNDLVLKDFSRFNLTWVHEESTSVHEMQDITAATNVTPSKEVGELSRILDSFVKTNDFLRLDYGKDLKASLAALENSNHTLTQHQSLSAFQNFDREVIMARQEMKDKYQQICNNLTANDDRSSWLQFGGLWPSQSPVALLELLRSSASHNFGRNMKEALVAYGILITNLQRLLRIKSAHLKRDEQKVDQEIRNVGHENWSPLKYTDWLLQEIDSDILIRPGQVDVADEMISPRSGFNSVLQLNMGQGKHKMIYTMIQ